MPGVRAILTADDLPAPADTLTDNGTVIKASRWGERGLTMEPVYHGEPILAVAAVDELTAVDLSGIRKSILNALVAVNAPHQSVDKSKHEAF